MKSQFIRRALMTGACSIAFAMPAQAQTAEETSEGDVIVVTAQNRTENIQDVPIAINVISGQALKEAGVTDFKDIGKLAPSVQITDDNSVIHVTVRGIGTYSNDESQDSSIVVNVDGEYLNRGEVMNLALFDLDRVEVLRGPQGTLYGRNSTGGAVNFITRKPGNRFAVNADASYGNFNTIKANAGIDIPFGDIGGIRFAGVYSDHDGYFKHAATPFAPAIVSGSDRVWGGRASLRLEPTSNLTINLAVEHAERKNINGAYGSVNLNAPGNGPAGPGCNAPGFVQVATAYTQTLCVPSGTNFLQSQDRSNYSQPLFGAGPGYKQDTTAVRGRIAYEFGPEATLTYTGGYRTSSRTGAQGLPVVYQSTTFNNDVKTNSHELRLNGVIGGVTYQVGGFYFKETIDNESGFFLQFLNPPPIPGFSANGTFLSYFGRRLSSDSWSGFGQFEVPLGEKLTAVAGLRYTDNSRSGNYANGSPFVFFGPTGTGAPIIAPGDILGTGLNTVYFGGGSTRKNIWGAGNPTGASYVNLNSSENKLTWLIGLNYKPNDDTLVYGKVSTGFKGGGFDSVGLYRPETNTAYEAGLKMSFGPGSQNHFNVSGFYYDYKDLQNAILLNTAVGGQVFNAGKATVYGIEAEALVKLTDNDTFAASVNYLHARYDDFLGQFNVFTVPGTGPDLTSVGDLDPNTPGIQQPNFAGNTTPYAPRLTITLGYDHVFDLGGAGTLKASAFTVYKSKYFTDFYNYNDLKQKSISSTDLSLEYKPENKQFSVQAFVRNLENHRALVYGGYVAAGPDDILNWGYGSPRTYGIRVGIDF
ncbi:TonB-dependent receptor [Aquisediminimonas profunda]|uniref:TonB-dependent receptor n=1 Tax=Aquisediminimonas profunda TaxID=1550733 RepID=UPI001C626608|nr:TonB-dependent receptor [Aquisediminimonas profunda]